MNFFCISVSYLIDFRVYMTIFFFPKKKNYLIFLGSNCLQMYQSHFRQSFRLVSLLAPDLDIIGTTLMLSMVRYFF